MSAVGWLADMWSSVVFSSSKEEVRRSGVISGGASFRMERTCLRVREREREGEGERES